MKLIIVTMTAESRLIYSYLFSQCFLCSPRINKIKNLWFLFIHFYRQHGFVLRRNFGCWYWLWWFVRRWQSVKRSVMMKGLWNKPMRAKLMMDGTNEGLIVGDNDNILRVSLIFMLWASFYGISFNKTFALSRYHSLTVTDFLNSF